MRVGEALIDLNQLNQSLATHTHNDMLSQRLKRLTISSLNFVPLESVGGQGDIVATINASNEGIVIAGKVDEVGGTYESGASGARILLFPDANTAIQIIDDSNNDVFKAIIGGVDIGDISLGDYINNQGLLYDKSRNSFSFKGILSSGRATLTGVMTTWADWGAATWDDKATEVWEDLGAALVMNGNVSFAINDVYNIGDTTNYPNRIYAHWFYGIETSIQSFDTHDDIGIFRGMKTRQVVDKDEKGKNITKEIFDLASLPEDVKQRIDYGNGHYNIQKYTGLLTGVIKQLIAILDNKKILLN
jgi:hypothetical protein